MFLNQTDKSSIFFKLSFVYDTIKKPTINKSSEKWKKIELFIEEYKKGLSPLIFKN